MTQALESAPVSDGRIERMWSMVPPSGGSLRGEFM